jgi:hypothetical protein
MEPQPDTYPVRTAETSSHRVRSIWQLVLSLVGVFLFWSATLIVTLVGLLQMLSRTASPMDTLPLFLMAAGFLLCGILLLPSAGYALIHLQGHPRTKRISLPKRFRPTLLILILPLILLIGYEVTRVESLAWLLLPLLHVLAIGLPVLWLVYIALHGLPPASPQRNWGVFASGLTLGPMLIFIIEIMALAAIFVFWIVWISIRPELAQELYILAERLQDSTFLPEDVLHILGPYLSKPLVIFGIFAFGAVVVPLIEEAIKPIGVWLLVNTPVTPALGFTAGALSGAGYALVESLALSSSGGEDWLLVVVARAGTAGIHILTTALMGWALAIAWREGQYLRLGLTYLLAVAIHGLWNGLTLMTVFGNLASITPTSADLGIFSQLSILAPYGLMILSLISFLALFLINKKLRVDQEIQPDQQGVVV